MEEHTLKSGKVKQRICHVFGEAWNGKFITKDTMVTTYSLPFGIYIPLKRVSQHSRSGELGDYPRNITDEIQEAGRTLN